jgi:hypothetical protein
MELLGHVDILWSSVAGVRLVRSRDSELLGYFWR